MVKSFPNLKQLPLFFFVGISRDRNRWIFEDCEQSLVRVNWKALCSFKGFFKDPIAKKLRLFLDPESKYVFPYVYFDGASKDKICGGRHGHQDGIRPLFPTLDV